MGISWFELILQLSAALVGGVGYALLYGAKGRLMIPATIGAGISWGIYTLALVQGQTPVVGCFYAAMGIQLWSELLARRQKAPVTVFLIIGLLPLVPGSGIYYTMQGIVQGDMSKAIHSGLETLGIALSMVLGVLVVMSLTQLFFRLRHRIPSTK